MTQTITFWEGDERFETDCTPYECGANWMHGLLVDCDGGDLYAWWAVDSFEWEQALVNANAPCFPAFEDDEHGDMSREAGKGAWDTLQRWCIDHLVGLYNDGKDEAGRVHWDEADEEFIDPDVGEWKPYLLQTWERDLIATFEDAGGMIRLLKTLDFDEALARHASDPYTDLEFDTTWYDTWLSYGKEPED